MSRRVCGNGVAKSRNFRIPDKLFRAIEKTARTKGISTSELVRRGCAQFIGQPELGEAMAGRKPPRK